MEHALETQRAREAIEQNTGGEMFEKSNKRSWLYGSVTLKHSDVHCAGMRSTVNASTDW